MTIDSYEAYCRALGGAAEAAQEARAAAGRILLFRQRMQELEARATKEGFLSTDALADLTDAELAPCAATDRDALSRLLAPLSADLRELLAHLRTKILREDLMMPLYKAREMDGRCIAWLSRRPGETLHQKLAGSPSILSVKRRMSYDTAENQLLKALLAALASMLELRETYGVSDLFDAEDKAFLEALEAAQRDEAFGDVGPWKNLPPNNTLISDRHYNIAWRCWQEVQELDTLVEEDAQDMAQRLRNLAVLALLRLLARAAYVPVQPLQIDFRTGGAVMAATGACAVEAYAGGGTIRMRWDDELGDDAIMIERGDAFYGLSFTAQGMELASSEAQQSCPITRENFSKTMEALQALVLPDVHRKWAPPVAAAPLASGVIDPFRMYPRALDLAGGAEQTLPARLCAQSFQWTDDDGEAEHQLLDAGRSACLQATSDDGIALWTLSDAMDRDDKEALQQLAAQLAAAFPARALALVYPDDCDAFRLAELQRSVRLFLPNVRLLPRSLAAVFTCLAQGTLQVGDGEVLFLADTNADGDVCVTPVRATYAQAVADAWPEGGGWTWERYPTYVEEAEDASLFAAWDALSLRREARAAKPLCIIDSDGTIRPVEEAADAREQAAVAVDGALHHARKRFARQERVQLLALAPHVACAADVQMADLSGTPLLAGAALFLAQEARVRHMAGRTLWRDHLPALAIQRLVGGFTLVSDRESYDYGSATQKDIPIAETFTLPKGVPEYHFRLSLEGSSGHHTYEAVIRHRAFPLKEDVVCRLKMRYQYGQDTPYDLRFRPIHPREAGFSEAVVTWSRSRDFSAADKMYPMFPELESWELLEHYPKKYDATQTENIVKEMAFRLTRLAHPISVELNPELTAERNGWYTFYFFLDGKARLATMQPNEFRNVQKEVREKIREDFDETLFVYVGMSEDKSPRYACAELPEGAWHQDYRGEWMATADVMLCGEMYTVTFQSSNFMFPEQFSPTLRRVYFYFIARDGKVKVNSYGKVWAKNIVDGTSPLRFYKLHHIDFLPQVPADQLLRPLFYLHMLYQNGRSSRSPDGPQEFLQPIGEAMKTLYRIFRGTDFSAPRNRDLFTCFINVFAIAHDDVPLSFYDDVEGYLDRCLAEETSPRHEVGFMLSDYTLPQHEKLWQSMARFPDDTVIMMLSRAVWRNEAFIKHAPTAVLLKYYDSAITFLRERYEALRGRMKAAPLEYILAVFRLRETGDAAVLQKLSLADPQTRSLYAWLEEHVKTHGFDDFRTRIELAVEQSPEYKRWHIPDFIYALLVYITGEDKDASIVISGISE